MELKNIHYKNIKPYWRNPRKNERTIEPLKEAIKKFGFLVPLVLDKDNVIITGHTRYKAVSAMVGQLDDYLKELTKSKSNKQLIDNLTEINKGYIPSIYAGGMSEKKAKEFRITDNKVPEYSEWDLEALETELKTIGGAIGFSLKELTQLIGEDVVEFENYTKEDMDKTKEALDKHFNKLYEASEEYVEVICPKCGEEFSLKKSEFDGKNVRYLTR